MFGRELLSSKVVCVYIERGIGVYECGMRVDVAFNERRLGGGCARCVEITVLACILQPDHLAGWRLCAHACLASSSPYAGPPSFKFSFNKCQ